MIRAVSPDRIDPVIGRPVMDGIAGARNDLAFAPVHHPIAQRHQFPLGLLGVILHADVAGGTIGTLSMLARCIVGDPRAPRRRTT
jgi:hypothetical protein